jgi:GDP-L-fucose synthase
MDSSSRIFVAGHGGLVGSAIYRRLQLAGFSNLIIRSRVELDLSNQTAVEEFFIAKSPEYVFLAAAKVGGILANARFPADFIRENLLIQTNVIDASYRHGVRKLLFLGSSCIYPKFAPQPIREDALLSGQLESTNEAYAVAKIAGVKMAQAYRRQHGFPAICLMPTNLYGPGDNFDPASAHVVPALIRKFHEAAQRGLQEVAIWGTGTARREFMHVDDLAAAAVFLMLNYEDESIVNVGTGQEVTIRELSELIREITGYSGRLSFDESMPDGAPRKLLDLSRLNATGWRACIPLAQGLRETYRWFLDRLHSSDCSRLNERTPHGSSVVNELAPN